MYIDDCSLTMNFCSAVRPFVENQSRRLSRNLRSRFIGPQSNPEKNRRCMTIEESRNNTRRGESPLPSGGRGREREEGGRVESRRSRNNSSMESIGDSGRCYILGAKPVGRIVPAIGRRMAPADGTGGRRGTPWTQDCANNSRNAV